jgi:hypothetical protein
MTNEQELSIRTLEIAAIMLGPVKKNPVKRVNKDMMDETQADGIIQPYLDLARYLERGILSGWKDQS